MKYYFLLGAFVISSGIYAQELFHNHLRFWTKEGIIEKQLEQNRKKAKIKKAYVYVATENWEVTDSNQPQYIIQYDSEGRITTHTKYLGAGENYKEHTTDSFLYDAKGNLEGYTHSVNNNGKYYYSQKATCETDSGLVKKVNFYQWTSNQKSNHPQYIFGLDSYYLFEYDSLKRKVAVRNFDKSGDEYNTWKIEYGKKGHIKEIELQTFFGGWQIYQPGYNSNGQLAVYKEFIQLNLDWRADTVTTTYTYDAQNRLQMRRDEIAKQQDYPWPRGCQYWYENNAIVPYRVLDEYERNLGGIRYIKDHLVYTFEYYK